MRAAYRFSSLHAVSMDSKRPRTTAGMVIIRAAVPVATAEFYRQLAAKEGIAISAIVAPLLNARARGEITNTFQQEPRK